MNAYTINVEPVRPMRLLDPRAWSLVVDWSNPYSALPAFVLLVAVVLTFVGLALPARAGPWRHSVRVRASMRRVWQVLHAVDHPRPSSSFLLSRSLLQVQILIFFCCFAWTLLSFAVVSVGMLVLLVGAWRCAGLYVTAGALGVVDLERPKPKPKDDADDDDFDDDYDEWAWTWRELRGGRRATDSCVRWRQARAIAPIELVRHGADSDTYDTRLLEVTLSPAPRPNGQPPGRYFHNFFAIFSFLSFIVVFLNACLLLYLCSFQKTTQKRLWNSPKR